MQRGSGTGLPRKVISSLVGVKEEELKAKNEKEATEATSIKCTNHLSPGTDLMISLIFRGT